MIYIPKPDGKAKRLSFLFIIGGIIVWMLSSLDIAYRIIAQISAIALIVVGVQILARYVLSEFKYVIEDNENGDADFIIYKKQGSRSVKVCDVSLGKIIAVFKLEDNLDYTQKYGKISNRFNYCQNLGKILVYSLLFLDGEKIIEVQFEPNGSFVSELNRRISFDGEGKSFTM